MSPTRPTLTANSRITLEVADPLEPLRLRLTLWLLPVGALAAFAALVMESENLSPPDRILLWPLIIGFLALEVLLLRRPQLIQQAWYAILGLIALYELVQVAYEAAVGINQQQNPSSALLWFPMVYLMAFVSLRRRAALLFSVGYLLLGCVLGGLGIALFSAPLSSSAVNTAVQFVLSNLTYVALLYLFSHLRTYYAQMHQMAYSDPLTTLLNRRGMQTALEAEFERFKASSMFGRRSQDPARGPSLGRKAQSHTFSIVLIDLDRFKQVNDLHGHAIGDQVLRETAQRLGSLLRDSDRLGRWGGEEFLVLVPETDLAQATALSQRLHEAVRGSPIAGLNITMSLGIASHRPGDTLATLLSRADEALYRAKSGGRDRIVREDEPEEPLITAHSL